MIRGLAQDRSARRTDEDGRLHVAVSNISKANVCPYYGREIPDADVLGLDPDRVYHLLRHPDELAAAAATFNNLPLLSKHVPVSAAEHMPDLVVGSTGTDAQFDGTYLRNSLVVWAQDAIDAIEDESQRELSSAYRYVADMKPGTYKGLRYDGVMRNIVGNHVALVEAGRAGKDVVVGDSAMLTSRKALMVSGALRAHLKPLLAADAKIDLTPVLSKITAKAYDKEAIFAGVKKATRGKLAQDADLNDVVGLLDALEDVTDGEVDADMVETAAEEKPDGDTPAVDADGDKMAELMAFLKGKLSDEDMASASKLMGDAPAEDAEPEGKTVPMVSKGAMDSAIAAAAANATRAALVEAAAIRIAEDAVAPHIGRLAVAQTSAASVYKLALDAAKVDLTGVPAEAYGAMVKLLPKPGETDDTRKPIAQDAATGASAWLDTIMKGA